MKIRGQGANPPKRNQPGVEGSFAIRPRIRTRTWFQSRVSTRNRKTRTRNVIRTNIRTRTRAVARMRTRMRTR